MRDVKRIERILNKIKIVWNHYPDTRLCQLIDNLLYQNNKRRKGNYFYVEDLEVEFYLDKYIKDNNLKINE